MMVLVMIYLGGGARSCEINFMPKYLSPPCSSDVAESRFVSFQVNSCTNCSLNYITRFHFKQKKKAWKGGMHGTYDPFGPSTNYHHCHNQNDITHARTFRLRNAVAIVMS